MKIEVRMSAKSILVLVISFIIGAAGISCTKPAPNPWHASLCAPAHYPVSSPSVHYFNRGAFIAGSFSMLSISQDWNLPTELSGPISVYPDSVFVSYRGLKSNGCVYLYEGGAKLPKEKIEALFKEGFIREGKKDDFSLIVTGLAPEGYACVRVNHIEICRFKAKEIRFIGTKPEFYVDGEELKRKNQEYSDYIKYHPVEDRNWEKADKGYDLDFGFCSEDGRSVYQNQTCYTREGLIYDPGYFTEITHWGIAYGKFNKDMIDSYIQYGEHFDYKMFLPVHAIYEWKNADQEFMATDVPMPKELPERFRQKYINPLTGKEAHYNRIVLGVEKDGKHAIIWLDGPGRQEKIMRFKGKERAVIDSFIHSGGYAEEVTYY